MTAQINLRHLLFKAFNVLKASKTRQHLRDIKHIIESGQPGGLPLEKLLEHACNTTPFYEKISPSKGMDSFPVIDKNSIKANYLDFQSTTFKAKKNRVVATSGSTGTPFKVFQDHNKVARNAADNLYFSELAGYTLGNELYYFRMWNAFEKKGLLYRWVLNMVPVDVFDLTDHYLKTFFENLQQSKTNKSWIGYASTFETLCKYLDKSNAAPIHCNLQSAIAISESLSPYTKLSLKKYFNVNVVSRYSNVENGIIAQQLPNTTYFLINTASYVVEILDLNTNKLLEHGKTGRIVVTDLFNYAMPLIRYDTGDIGAMKCIDHQLVLSTVEGRKIDAITNTKGEVIANNILLLVNKYHELNQCQLIQKTDNQYLFKINIDGPFKNEAKFIAEFKTHLGSDAMIDIMYVNEIPLLASGKRRVMVNENNSCIK